MSVGLSLGLLLLVILAVIFILITCQLYTKMWSARSAGFDAGYNVGYGHGHNKYQIDTATQPSPSEQALKEAWARGYGDCSSEIFSAIKNDPENFTDSVLKIAKENIK